MENILLFKNEKVIQQNGNQSPRILEVKHISTRELIAHDILLGKRFLAYDSPLDLVYVLYHREFEKKFREYLEKTYCSENFNFWVAAVQYSKTKNAQFRIEMATTIMETFFNDSSPQQVNIPESISLKLQARYQFGDIDVFDEARVHVWSLLSQESYSRFAQIPEFTPTYLSRRQESLEQYGPAFDDNVLTEIFNRFELNLTKATASKLWKLKENYQGISVYARKIDKLSDALKPSKSKEKILIGQTAFDGIRTAIEMEVPIEIIQKILKQPIGSLKLWVRGFHSGRIVEEISECMTIQHWFFGIADSEIEEMKIKRDYVVLRKVFTTDSLKKHGIIVPEKSFVVIEKSVQHRDAPISPKYTRCSFLYTLRMVSPVIEQPGHCKLESMVLLDASKKASVNKFNMLEFVTEELIDQNINLERLGKEFFEKYKIQKKKPK